MLFVCGANILQAGLSGASEQAKTTKTGRAAQTEDQAQ